MYAGTQIGRYEIRSKIGEGGMGEVYSALDHELDRNVAIKLLPFEFTVDEDRRNRFRQEARVVSALNHPNIITIFEIGEDEHGSYLATELVEGKTLREVLKTESLTLVRMLKIIEQTANALVAAHQAHIIHRDIKPENIMVRQDSIVKVLDFGLAKSKYALGEGADANKTLPGTVMGSARYMSPEQARGHEVDERTDIWSLGVVLYEMLIGKAPFDGETTADTIAAVVYKEPVPLVDHLPNIPPELTRIVRKALQKDREERYQSVKDFALDVRELLHELEHTNSGRRSGHTTSSPDFNENPTMLHRTVSGNHPTGNATVLTSVPSHGGGPQRSFSLKRTAGVAAALSLLALIAAGFYSYLGNEERQAETAFIKPQISRINTDGRVALPAISPDGKYIAYVSGEIGNRSLVVRQVATDSTITLVPATNLVVKSISFSPSGDHVYFTQTSSDFSISTLYQVPTLGGTPKRLVEDVDSPVAFTPDGKRFAFIRHIPKTNADTIYLVDTETLELEEFLSTPATEYNMFVFRLAFSPDGKKLLAGGGIRQSGFLMKTDVVEIDVATKKLRPLNRREFQMVTNFGWLEDGSGYVFTARPTQNDNVQIWLASYPEGELHQVTNDLNDYADLGISGDGRTMVTIKGDATGSLWRIPAAGNAPAQITSDGRAVEGKAGVLATRDGKIIYTRNEGKTAQLWQADADGKNAAVLFADTGFAVDPALSPDGKTLVFNLQKDRRSRIWRINADGSGPAQLTADEANTLDLMPQITADGRSVIFQRQAEGEERFKLMRVPIEGGPAEIFYEHESRGVFHPRMSPDGKRMAFVTYDLANFEKRLHIAAIEDGKVKAIERDIEYNLINNYVWSPDGKELTVLTNRGGAMNLWRQPIDGSPATPITDFSSGLIFNFSWSADGRELLVARGSINNDLILIKDGLREAADVSLRRAGPRERS
ncbi:MAG: serine/threonine-protein kinase [Acidobacteria bacterium]|nr:serine/threonine-protein kinase [Acidobacteriota bacterium]